MRKVPPELGEWVLRRTDQPGSREALSVRVSHRFTAGSARFDEDNLVSDAGLVPLLGLAEQTGLAEILAEQVSITTSRIKSGAANPAPKLLGVIAGMCAGADSIDDLDVLRAGGMPILFDGVYAPSTLGTLLREFSFGHACLESVLREHVCALTERTDLLVGIDEQVFIDIDSLLRPVAHGQSRCGACSATRRGKATRVGSPGRVPRRSNRSAPSARPNGQVLHLRVGRFSRTGPPPAGYPARGEPDRPPPATAAGRGRHGGGPGLGAAQRVPAPAGAGPAHPPAGGVAACDDARLEARSPRLCAMTEPGMGDRGEATLDGPQTQDGSVTAATSQPVRPP
jgi:hypothetical protein